MQWVNNLQHHAGVHLAPVTGSASSELEAVPRVDPLSRYSNISSGGKSWISYCIVIPVSSPRNISWYPISMAEYRSDASARNRPKWVVQTQIETPSPLSFFAGSGARTRRDFKFSDSGSACDAWLGSLIWTPLQLTEILYLSIGVAYVRIWEDQWYYR
jgi:hypothetical protein